MKEDPIFEKKIDPDQEASTNLDQNQGEDGSMSPSSRSRRAFIGKVTAASIAAGVLGVPAMLKSQDIVDGETGFVDETAETPPPAGCNFGCDIGPETPTARAVTSRRVRVSAADFEKNKPIPEHPCNGDEVRYRNRNFFASYSKGLPHDSFGEVNPVAYCALTKALKTGNPADFELIPLGCSGATLQTDTEARFAAPNAATAPTQRRLVNPQAALAFDLEGADSHHLAIPPAPTFRSAEEAGEIGENYWMALARDVHFSNYAINPITLRAAEDLSRFSDFKGPKENGQVTPKTLFRGFTKGDLKGPYISQFMLLDMPFGAQMLDPRILAVRPDIDYMTRYSEPSTSNGWLEIQKGCTPMAMDQFDGKRFIRNGRDIGQYVHIDVLFQAYFNAMLILLTPKAGGGIGAPFDANNPYTSANSQTQDGFGTFGGPHIATLMCEVATRALKAVWYEKWSVHRRLRPEVFGGRIHNHLTGVRRYPIHQEILNSPVLTEIFNKFGSFLLPMAFPEGSPLHPAYGAGHATVAGACVTILKAWFKESTTLVSLGVTPVVASADGLSRVPYTGADKNELTVGSELDKLASNISVGRDFAGVHWRSDYTESVKLGEALAISILEDSGFTYNEIFKGFSLTKFDGTTITVGEKRPLLTVCS